MSYLGVVLMKKTISILITIALLFSITACTKEPESYVADDFSYLMFDGVKYERVEMPFDISVGNTLGSNWTHSSTYFRNIYQLEFYLYHYNAAKRDPLVWWSDNYYQLYEATLGDGDTVKVVSNYDDPIFVYTLPENKQYIEQRFQNSAYLAENCYIVIESNHRDAFTLQISPELAATVVEKHEFFMNNTQFNTHDKYFDVYINEDNFDVCIGEDCFVFLTDNNGDFKKALFELFVTSEGIMLIENRFICCTSKRFLPDGKSFTPISEIEYLFLPDEFSDELAPVIEEIMRIREERLASQ